MAEKTLILVFDGLSFHRVREWAHGGRMPAFRRLIKTGAFGRLRSTVPPVTAPAAVALLVGVGPERSGIYDFTRLGFGPNPRGALVGIEDVGLPAVHDVLFAFGKRAGLFGVPLAYPPPGSAAFAVVGLGAPRGGEYARPGDVAAEVRARGYSPSGPEVDPTSPSAPRELADGLLRDWETFLSIAKRHSPDMAICWLTETDHASHYFWRDGEKLAAVYEAADDVLESAMEEGEWDVLIVASDHGFTDLSAAFYANAALASRGLLKYKRGPTVAVKMAATRLIRYLRSRSARVDAAAAGGVRSSRRGGVIRSLAARLTLSFEDVDWSRSAAVAVGPPTEYALVYVRPDVAEEELASIFNALVDAPGVESVTVRESQPRIVAKLRDDVAFTPSLPVGGEVLRRPPWRSITGKHHVDGVIGFHGDGVREGAEIAADIVDVLPTALALVDVPIPEFLEGSPIASAFYELREPGRISLAAIRAKIAARRATTRMARETPIRTPPRATTDSLR